MPRKATAKKHIALDGPSALKLYRDRALTPSSPIFDAPSADDESGFVPDPTAPDDDFDIIWPDEDPNYLAGPGLSGMSFASPDSWDAADLTAFGNEWLAGEFAFLAETNVFGRGGRPSMAEKIASLSGDSDAQSPTQATAKPPRAPRRSAGDPSAVVNPALPPLIPTDRYSLRTCATRSADLKLIDWDSLGIPARTPTCPLCLLVPNKLATRTVKGVKERGCAATIPRHGFYLLGETALVPSPEFTFVLMARHLSPIGLLMLGMELCGHYRIKGAGTLRPLDGEGTLYDQPALTNVAKLRKFLKNAKGFPGYRKAQRCLRYLADDAASPMESALYLLLCLPRSMGGYGLARPILNAKRPVRGPAEALTLADYLIPDLYWPSAGLDLEYDSEEFHSGLEALKLGARRTMALRLMRVEAVSVTWDMVRDAVAFEGVARLVARRTGGRIYRATDSVAAERTKLRDALLGGIGLYEE